MDQTVMIESVPREEVTTRPCQLEGLKVVPTIDEASTNYVLAYANDQYTSFARQNIDLGLWESITINVLSYHEMWRISISTGTKATCLSIYNGW